METEISRLAHDGLYDEAKEMRARLTQLHAEFGSLQTTGARVVRSDQDVLFETGSKTLVAQERQRQADAKRQVEKKCADLRADQQKSHEIQWENLEKVISKITMPSQKYSKRLIELFKAEAG
jgi:hypothetical protein